MQNNDTTFRCWIHWNVTSVVPIVNVTRCKVGGSAVCSDALGLASTDRLHVSSKAGTWLKLEAVD